MIEWLMNNTLEDLWKAAVVALFVLIAYVSVFGAAEENNEITTEAWEI
jgi:hypothetical protein